MKKIKISAGYDSSENLTNRLILQFKTPEIDLSNIEFVYDDSYDVVVFFNYINGEIVDGKRAYIFPHEPSWSGSHQKYVPENVTIFGFDPKLYNQNCITSIAHTYYGGRGPWVDSLDFWCYNNFVTFSTNKIKNISCSITDLNTDYGDTCLYPQRYMINQMIKTLDYIDYYGGGDCSPLRKDSLVNYKFNLVVENEYENNWVTEKFYDAILTQTVPIYFGCKNIKELYPEDGYILIKDINNINEIKKLLSDINNNCDEIYSSKIDGMKEIKKKYFDENNLLKKIIRL